MLDSSYQGLELRKEDGGAGDRWRCWCERNKERVREKDEIFCFGEEEKEEWRDSENLEGICAFLF